jgi:hypothetical protein
MSDNVIHVDFSGRNERPIEIHTIEADAQMDQWVEESDQRGYVEVRCHSFDIDGDIGVKMTAAQALALGEQLMRVAMKVANE